MVTAHMHNDWHAENGAAGTVLCPWDCYDPFYDDDDDDDDDDDE